MDSSIVTSAVNGKAMLGECPVWSAAEARLYWIDIDGRVVHRFDPTSGVDETRGLATRPGAITCTTQPGVLLVATEHQLCWFDFDANVLTPYLDLEPAGTGNRLNDGRCDPAGRFLVGSMFADTADGRATGTLYQIDGSQSPIFSPAAHQLSPSGSPTVTELRHDIRVANGLAFDAERGRMYFADTPTETIRSFDYDVETGSVSNEQLFFDYATIDGKPDGACLDSDGCYWSASVYGWAVTRITPDGVLDRRIEVPVEKPSMPAFGGPNLDTMFVTTIGSGGTVPSAPGRGGHEPGALLALDVGITGMPEPLFATAPPSTSQR